MTRRVYAMNIFGDDGALSPRLIKIMLNSALEVYPVCMSLPRWEPTWVASMIIDHTLDDGQDPTKHPDHPGWNEEPSARTLDHVLDHVLSAQAQVLADGEQTDEAYVTELSHAMTRLAMELARVRRKLLAEGPDQ